MLRIVLTRLFDAIPTVLLVLTLVFVSLRLLPGDPALVALGDQATAEQLELFREQTGLNAPIWEQYLTFLRDAVTLDFGTSLITGQPVLDTIARNLPYTLELTFVAVLLGALMGIPFGIFAAVRKNKLPDQSMRVFTLIGYAIPDFYLGALLLLFFGLNLGLFPVIGGGEGFLDRLHHVALPALTLAFVKIAFIGRLTRTALLEVLSKEYVRTARAKGAPERDVLLKHAMRNAMLPVTTGLGLSILATLSGSVAIELVFNRPGLGEMLMSAIAQRDYPMIQGGVIVFALFVVVVNTLVDIGYQIVDPRLRKAA
ncbi:ABC transporter permease [Falsirhodobacter xinxiangensis]|uniref:ABC transporter permease n=1 Tax=Falsirhodobacter xinxiangensis TaxID=2530049 RepID=UPI0010AB1DEB|nr:ABC transporter permease [Rhodobacter xinxiangensis]